MDGHDWYLHFIMLNMNEFINVMTDNSLTSLGIIVKQMEGMEIIADPTHQPQEYINHCSFSTECNP